MRMANLGQKEYMLRHPEKKNTSEVQSITVRTVMLELSLLLHYDFLRISSNIQFSFNYYNSKPSFLNFKKNHLENLKSLKLL
jgi:hypothetical protein